MVVFSVLKSSEYSFYCFWIPFSWASCLVQEAKKAGRITDVLFCIELQREIDKAGIDKWYSNFWSVFEPPMCFWASNLPLDPILFTLTYYVWWTTPPLNLDIIYQCLQTKNGCFAIMSYDWVNFPLAYTQVVTIAVYSYFGFALLGRQYLDPSKVHIYPGTYWLSSDWFFRYSSRGSEKGKFNG